jgi:hypothetical protein
LRLSVGTAVDSQVRAGDIGCLRTGDKRHQRGDFVNRSVTVERCGGLLREPLEGRSIRVFVEVLYVEICFSGSAFYFLAPHVALHRLRRTVRPGLPKIQSSGFELGWESRPFEKQQKAKRASKTKFTCPGCGQNAWAKPDAKLICGAGADFVTLCRKATRQEAAGSIARGREMLNQAKRVCSTGLRILGYGCSIRIERRT